MHKAALMQITQSLYYLHHVKLDCILIKSLVLLHYLVKLASINEGHYIEQTRLSLEKVIHFCKEWVLNLAHYTTLSVYFIYCIGFENDVFTDNLYSIRFFNVCMMSLENLPLTSLTYLFQNLEVLQLNSGFLGTNIGEL